MEKFASILLSQIKKIEIYQNKSRLYMHKIAEQTGADYIINGTIYDVNKFKPYGNVKIDGQIIKNPQYKEYGMAWTKGSDIAYEPLPSPKDNYIGCVGLLLNGAAQKTYYNADMKGTRPRSCIGILGNQLMLYACNGIHSKTPEKLQSYLKSKGWDSALMLDGGGSTQCIFNGSALTSAENRGNGRIVQNYILIYLKTAKKKCPYTEPKVLIREGTRGVGAQWLQWHLNHVYGAGLDVDGIIGAKSIAALKMFQKEHGLTADGLCGQLTRTKLKQLV